MTAHLVPTLVVVAHWLIVIGLSLRVIMRRPPVGAALGWLAVVFSIPFVGAAVYLLFGEKRLGPRREAQVGSRGPRRTESHFVVAGPRAPLYHHCLRCFRDLLKVGKFKEMLS